MTTFFFLLYLLAGVFFGLAASRVVRKVDFLALGLMMWVFVDIIKTFQKL